MRIFLTLLILIITGLATNPVFVEASSTCYVDKDADSGGDGSEESPYTKISKALEEDCKNISVKKGTYSETIVLDKGVELEGDNRDSVQLKGGVTMKDDSKIKNITIITEGIKVYESASVEVDSVTIKNTGTGIETTGGGKLIVKNSKIHENGKGLYLQKGKNISITSSTISNNTEEGIDIRSNVDGIISGNTIENNGESGIEVVLGKSDLTISNNKIKSNRASGIATQFYDSASKLGGVKINNNTISKNKDFAVNCKLPSGGKLSEGYWSKSVSFIGNTISDNKDGAFAQNCNFSESEITNATKTQEDLDKEEQERIDALDKLKEDPGEVAGSIKILKTPSGRLNVRVGPSTSYEIVSSVKVGETYGYVSKENGWYKTVVSDSLWGWVSGGYVEEVVEKEEIEEYAEKIEEITTESFPEEEVLGEVQEETPEDKNNDAFVFGTVALGLILFLIFLFSPLPDKIFTKKDRITIPNERKKDINIDNF